MLKTKINRGNRHRQRLSRFKRSSRYSRYNGCKLSTNMNLKNCNIRNIHAETFYKCIGLAEIILPQYLSGIGEVAFKDCITMTNITFPSNLRTILYNAFNWCIKLNKVTLHTCTNLTEIKKAAFYGCSGLTEITLPINNINIYEEAFADCTELNKITLYKSSQNPNPQIQFLNKPNVFENCNNVTMIEIHEENNDTNVKEITSDFSVFKPDMLPTLISNIVNNSFKESNKNIYIEEHKDGFGDENDN